MVELAPAIAPVVVDVDRVPMRERLQQPPLSVGVGVDGELEAFRTLDLLEALREEPQDERARLLGLLGQDDDGDAPQRNALFSFSKRPWSARYVRSSSRRWNSRSSCRCSSSSCSGTSTFTSTR